MADYVPIKRARAAISESSSEYQQQQQTTVVVPPSFTTWPPPRLCQRCKQTYDPRNNHHTYCLYHPEYYSGETIQSQFGTSSFNNTTQIHYFWTCCGSPFIDSPGCSRGQHISYDEQMPVVRTTPTNTTISNPSININNNNSDNPVMIEIEQ
jgi:hypothetical protein